MTPAEAQAAYVAADDEFALHRSQCYQCGNSRIKHRVACPEGDSLRLAAWDKRNEWAQAVAAERERTAASHEACPRCANLDGTMTESCYCREECEQP